MKELSRRNDAYINNMLLQKSQHSTEHIQAATLIYEERGLADPAKQELIKQYPALRKETFQNYQQGITAEDLASYLISKGVSKQDSLEMIKNAVTKQSKVIEKENERKRNISLMISIAIGLAFFIFRLLT